MYLTDIRLIMLLFLLSMFSCNNSDKNFELEVLVSDTVRVEEKVLVRIYSNKNDWKIIKAYFDCEDNLKSDKIDIMSETVEGCVKELFVKNDTIIIQFIPAKLGLGEFGLIKALLKKGTDEFKVLESNFSYVVVQGSE